MKKILIIEDQLEVRENLEEILELYGYTTITAENGKTGIEAALTQAPDLILCDVMMPELDGFGVLNILSRKSATADIPFIFLTAKTALSDMRRGMKLGADDYITKPFYKDELLEVVELRLKKSERLKNKASGKKGFSAFINEAKGYAALKELSNNHAVKGFKRKEMIFDEGSYPRYLYYIKSGKVKICKTNEYGKEFIINIRTIGDFIGYTALIKNENYGFSAIALEDSQLSLIPKDDFSKLLHADRDVAARFIKILVNNVAEKEEQLLNLAYNSVRKRVANALLLIDSRYKDNEKKEIKFLRDDLARLVGTAKESVIRMLTEFKKDGYIDIKNGMITILNKKKLEEIP